MRCAWFGLCLWLWLASAPAWAQTASERLQLLMDREWTLLLEENPLLAIYLGQPTSRLWADNSAARRQATRDRYAATLQELAALDPSQLDPGQRVNARLFAQQLRWQLERHRLGLDLFAMNQREGPHTVATMLDSIAFDTLEDYRLWVERMESFATYVDGEIALLEEGLARGRVHPRGIVETLRERVAVQVSLAQQPDTSSFLEPFRRAPERIQADPQWSELEARAQRALRQAVGPAFAKLERFLAGPYAAAAPAEVGLGRLPGGPEAYQFLVERYTTTDKTAQQVHQIGLAEVARIRGEMERIRQQLGFAGSLEELFDQLRQDPQHYVQDGQELLRRYRAFCKRVDGQMPRFFRTLPRKPYGVEPIPEYIAPATTTAYYMPGAGSLAGTYCVNLYQPQTRALFEIPALSLHEAVPGHHHQIALAGELPHLPPFRRHSDGFGDYTVFVEGWALYAESLGAEMGLYETPYERLGQLSFEIWRAIRLVVDTGLHTQGWTREQAIDYFLANSPRSRLDVTNEVDRYISWPGQALAYKMGELEIHELRRWAEKELGPRFDLRDFHDAVLLQGAVPLDQLRDQVRSYVDSRRSES